MRDTSCIYDNKKTLIRFMHNENITKKCSIFSQSGITFPKTTTYAIT